MKRSKGGQTRQLETFRVLDKKRGTRKKRDKTPTHYSHFRYHISHGKDDALAA